ncbi:hypothetical protein G9A89_006459 [Geosiphon pyriformis]|nr:hypothetical protein G9A89_006459 [Geosiphon pyriformis]
METFTKALSKTFLDSNQMAPMEMDNVELELRKIDHHKILNTRPYHHNDETNQPHQATIELPSQTQLQQKLDYFSHAAEYLTPTGTLFSESRNSSRHNSFRNSSFLNTLKHLTTPKYEEEDCFFLQEIIPRTFHSRSSSSSSDYSDSEDELDVDALFYNRPRSNVRVRTSGVFDFSLNDFLRHNEYMDDTLNFEASETYKLTS